MKIKMFVALLLVVILVSFSLFNCASPEVTSAKVYFQQDNIDAAEEQLLIALEKEPNNPEVPFLLATGVYIPKKEWIKAKEMLLKSIEIDPNYVNSETKTTAEDQLNKLWAELHTEGTNYFNKSINATLKVEKDSLLSKAAEKFQLALSVKSDEPLTYNGIVKCYFLLGDTLRVEEYAVKALENGIFDEDVMYYYTRVMWQQGRQDEVLALINKLSVEHPEALELKLQQIQFLSEIERYDEALEKAKNLSIEYPDDLDIKFIMAQLYAKLGDMESAQYEYQKILAQNPEDVEVLMRIAEIYFNDKNWVMAEEYSRRLIEVDPENVFGYDVLWKSLFNQGKREEAEKYRAIEKSLQEGQIKQ
jgi:tetratricopeptide (TPR) repeat protein